MKISFDKPGSVGIIKDIPPHELPQNAWSDGLNVRFYDNKVEKTKGYEAVGDSSTASPSIAVAPYWLIPVTTTTNAFWCYAGLNKVYGTDLTTHADITRSAGGDYSASANVGWNGGMLGGIAILNNGNNVPQQWGDSASEAALTKPLLPLANWPAGMTAKVVRPFKEYLVALHVTESAVENPKLLRWSHPADPGDVPSSWDYTDPTIDAGRIELKQTNDNLVDCLPLRDVNIIYKESSAWGMQHIGGNAIFRFYRIFDDLGMVTRKCVKQFFGKHFVYTRDDVIIHDGQNAEPVFNRRFMTWLQSQIDSSNFEKVFVAPDYANNEMWLCYPQVGSTQPDTAVVWNWRENTTTIRELPNVSHIGFGVVNPGISSTIDGLDGSIGGLTGSFDDQTYNPTLQKLLMAVPDATPKLYVTNDVETNDGTNFLSYVERIALPLGRQGSDGQIKPDLKSIKYVRHIYPRIEGTDGESVDVYVGGQSHLGDSVAWKGPFPFTLGTDYKIDCRVTDRLIGIRFETSANMSWSLSGFDVDFTMEGDR